MGKTRRKSRGSISPDYKKILKDELPIAERKRMKSVMALTRRQKQKKQESRKQQQQQQQKPNPSAISRIPTEILIGQHFANYTASPLTCRTTLLSSPELCLRERFAMAREERQAKRAGAAWFLSFPPTKAEDFPTSPLTCATDLLSTPEFHGRKTFQRVNLDKNALLRKV